MYRTTAHLALLLLLVLAFASPAFAHGGQYRGPGGHVPPGLKEPGDPTPPPPPPPGSPPTTGEPTTPSAPGAPPQPTDPGTPTPPSTTPGDTPTPQGRRPGANSLGMDSWMFWYEYNKSQLQNLKKSIYADYDTDSPWTSMGSGGHTTRSGRSQATRALTHSTIIPAMRWAMEMKNSDHQDTQSAAYIALAKITNDPSDIERIQAGIESKNYITRESSALALGLLRRARQSDQFDAITLDKVRTFLFQVFENDKHIARTRAFAALALGLLADQPTGSERYAGGHATTARLFELLQRSYKHPDLRVGLLVGISMQSPETVTEEQRKLLRVCAGVGRIKNDEARRNVRQFAALALGRLSHRGEDVLFLQRLLTQRRNANANVQRSVAIALGEVGSRVSAEDRVGIANTLIDALRKKRLRDASAKNFAIISLSYLVAADVREDRTNVMGSTKVKDMLIDFTENGSTSTRPYGALALGLICRAIGDETDVDFYGEFQAEARDILRAGLLGRKMGTRERAGFAVALGIALDDRSIKDLAEIVGNEKLDQELRGYAALAIGHIGIPQQDALTTLRKSLRQRTSEALRRSTATALGMLKDRKAVDLLLEELRLARTMSAKGQVVVALARIGDERAIEPLVKLLKNADEHDMTRALACAGLGIVGDLEWVPSLSLLSNDINYRAAGDAINEALSIL